MKTTPTKIPAIPSTGTSVPALTNSVNAIKEAVEVGLGRRGDTLDRFVTVRELRDSGIASAKSDGSGGISAGSGADGTQVSVDVPGTINGLPDNTPPDYGQGDFTSPPVPTGILVKAVAPTNLMVVWNPPAYGNHAYAEVYIISADQAPAGTLSFTTFLSISPGFNQTKVCTGNGVGSNPNKWLRTKSDGSNTTITLSSAELGNGGSTLGALVNPAPWYAFVRFVSLAGVPGPFGPANGFAASGAPSIDPLRVLDLMTAQVQGSNLYANLTSFLGPNPAAVGGNGGVSGIYTTTTDNSNSLNQLYSVRAGTTLPDGNIIAAGFGLGITVDNVTGTAQSIFAVNANKFAIMGAGTTYTPIVSFTKTDNQNGSFNVVSNISDIIASFNASQATGSTTQCVVVIKSAVDGDSFDGVEATVTAINSKRITCTINTPALQTNLNVWPTFDTSKKKYITLAANIPFIVDTVTNTVGIRGSLIVDGLVRGTSGDFDTLSAGTAFIGSLRAGIVNANLVCGQRIIAGAGIPDTAIVDGAIDDTVLTTLDAWIVELSTPGPGQFPFQIYNPKRSAQPGGILMQVFGGNPANGTLPYLYVNGDFRLGGNATLNLRQGGAVAMGNRSADGLAYTFWAGADADYATSASNMENKGFVWIRPSTLAEQAVTGSTAQGGMNLDLFLGKNALALPSFGTGVTNPGASFTKNIQGDNKSSTIQANSLVQTAMSASPIVVRSLKGGDKAPTVFMISGYLASYYGDGSVTNNGDSKCFELKADLYQNGQFSQNIQTMLFDDWSPETMPINMTNIIQVGAGTYTVQLTVTRYDDRNMSIIQGWNCIAFQGAVNGALS